MPPKTLVFSPKVSVIVPVYNVELYIEECLQSLFRQTLDCLEIIVVDDGSTDSTVSIVKSLLPPPGKSLRLISKPNGGLSSARNLGISIADGEWIGLVDGDDWVQPSMYEDMACYAEADNAYLAICKGYLIDSETKRERPFQDNTLWESLISKDAQLFDPSATPDLFILDTSACRRLYRRSFLKASNFEFADGFLFEDVLANYQLLSKTSRVVLVNKPFYCYRVGHSDRITSRKDAKILQIIEIMQKCIMELIGYQASSELWANFIWFQNWVLLWLCAQIDDADTDKFIQGAFNIARQFPKNGIRCFRRKFSDDERAQRGVFLQLLGWNSAYSNFAKTGEMPKLQKHLFTFEPIHQIIQFRARRCPTDQSSPK